MDQRRVHISLFALVACLLSPFWLTLFATAQCDSCDGRTSAPTTGTWESVGTDLFSPRHHPIAFSGNGSGYIMAGVDGVFDMYRYNPATRNLTFFDVPAGSPKPVWRTFSYGTSIGDIAFLGFGVSTGRTALRDWWKYDTVNNVFTELASLPNEAQARWHPAVVPFECDRGSGKEWFILVSCGSSPIGNLKDTWEYRLRDNTWTNRPDLPGAARHHPFYFDATTSSGNQSAFVGFGHAASSEGYIKKDLYQYNPTQMMWTKMQDFPGEARVAGTEFSVKYGGTTIKGYVLSGDGDNHGSMSTGEFWEYNAQNDTWRSLPPHPGISRWAPGSFVIGCTVYLVAGYNRQTRTALDDIWSYPLSTASCPQTTVTETPTSSSSSTTVAEYPTSSAAGMRSVEYDHSQSSGVEPIIKDSSSIIPTKVPNTDSKPNEVQQSSIQGDGALLGAENLVIPPDQAATPQANKPAISAGVVAGIAIGVVVVLLAGILGAVIYIMRRRGPKLHYSIHSTRDLTSRSETKYDIPNDEINEEEGREECGRGGVIISPPDETKRTEHTEDRDVIPQSSPDLPKADSESSVRGLRFDDI